MRGSPPRRGNCVDRFPDRGLHPAVTCDVDFPAQQAFEFQHESRLVEETGSLAPCHEQIDVDVRAGVAARDRSDQPHLRGAVPGGGVDDGLTLLADCFADSRVRHGLM